MLQVLRRWGRTHICTWPPQVWKKLQKSFPWVWWPWGLWRSTPLLSSIALLSQETRPLSSLVWFFRAVLLASASSSALLNCQLLLLPQGLRLQPLERHQTHQCKLHPDCWPCAHAEGVWGIPWRQGKNTIERIVDPGMAGELWMAQWLMFTAGTFCYMTRSCPMDLIDPCTHLAEQVQGTLPHASKRFFLSWRLCIEAAGAHSPWNVYLSVFTVGFLAFTPTPPPFPCVEVHEAELVFF